MTVPLRTDEELDRLCTMILEAPPHRAFGLRLRERSPGEAVLEVEAGEATSVDGQFHGGLYGLLMEPAALMALISMLPRNRKPVTVDSHLQVLRSVPPGATITLKGRVVRAGAQISFCEVEAQAGDRLLAQARITKAVVPVAD